MNRLHPSGEQHPIERIMGIAMTKLKDLVDTDTIVGSPMSTVDGTVIIPISKVAMGFVTGGGEYDSAKEVSEFPFAGGSGAGISVTPTGFLVGHNGIYQMVSVEHASAYEKLLDLVPQILASAENKDEE